MSEERPRLTAYVVGQTDGWSLEPSSPKRAWMDATGGFAYRCLPLTIANQCGWVIRSPAPFQAVWNGGDTVGDTAVLVAPGYERYSDQIISHFGWGVVTFSLPWLFRTSEGFSLLVRGPTNTPKAYATALDGIVETDWATSTFTMNWRLTEPDKIVRFERGEAICHLMPIRLADHEAMQTGVLSITDDPALQEAYRAWSASRNAFNNDPSRQPRDWQKDYFRGEQADGEKAREHRSKLKIDPFDAHS